MVNRRVAEEYGGVEIRQPVQEQQVIPAKVSNLVLLIGIGAGILTRSPAAILGAIGGTIISNIINRKLAE